jgi:hypothetical protein
MSFEYLAAKIATAEFVETPFRHISINNFFSAEHFDSITSAREINVGNLRSDEELFDELFARGYKIIEFPGCIIDRKTYIDWHRARENKRVMNNSACEGFGVTLRLDESKTKIISDLDDFLKSEEFQFAIAEKFGIDRSKTFNDSGIQKYLDGYEISPHPDVRKKALTYMVNINPSKESGDAEHHPQYMRLIEKFKYVQAFWEGNPNADRCWVPWSWCESVSIQRDNNSIVIFSPSNTTMHAVKAKYNHLTAQRTQLYGNLWYKEDDIEDKPEWEDLLISRDGVTGKGTRPSSFGGRARNYISRLVSRAKFPDRHVISDRLRNR